LKIPSCLVQSLTIYEFILAKREKCDSALPFRISAQIQNVAMPAKMAPPEFANGKSFLTTLAVNHFRCGKQAMMYLLKTFAAPAALETSAV
jgi:hypothetical protein